MSDSRAAGGPRAADVDVVVVGAGFAGLYLLHKLRGLGFTVRALEAAGDVGGTWYWNRYPGAQCDTASFVYMPLLEETGFMPKEKYTKAPEILAHSVLSAISSKFVQRPEARCALVPLLSPIGHLLCGGLQPIMI